MSISQPHTPDNKRPRLIVTNGHGRLHLGHGYSVMSRLFSIGKGCQYRYFELLELVAAPGVC